MHGAAALAQLLLLSPEGDTYQSAATAGIEASIISSISTKPEARRVGRAQSGVAPRVAWCSDMTGTSPAVNWKR
ncbi:MAG: hypothetical protein J0H15_01300 [Xanthomonadales bacterium]|nr:hypothetical protein [Xanthomonadales bacterium]